MPTDRADFENQVYTPTGDGEEVPLGYTKEWSGLVKLTNTSLANSKINYQAIFNQSESRRTNCAFRFNPDGLSTQESFSISHGLDWTQTLGAVDLPGCQPAPELLQVRGFRLRRRL